MISQTFHAFTSLQLDLFTLYWLSSVLFGDWYQRELFKLLLVLCYLRYHILLWWGQGGYTIVDHLNNEDISYQLGLKDKHKIQSFNSLSKNKVLHKSKLKVFADDKINVNEKLKFVLQQVEKTLWEKEKMLYSNGFFPRSLKVRIVW